MWIPHALLLRLLDPRVLLALARNGFRRTSWAYIGSLVLSLAGFLLVFPEFFDFLPVYRSEPPTERYTILEQTKVLLYSGWATFFATAHVGRYLAMALIAALGISLVAVPRVRERWKGALRKTERRSFFLWSQLVRGFHDRFLPRTYRTAPSRWRTVLRLHLALVRLCSGGPGSHGDTPRLGRQRPW